MATLYGALTYHRSHVPLDELYDSNSLVRLVESNPGSSSGPCRVVYFEPGVKSQFRRRG